MFSYLCIEILKTWGNKAYSATSNPHAGYWSHSAPRNSTGNTDGRKQIRTKAERGLENPNKRDVGLCASPLHKKSFMGQEFKLFSKKKKKKKKKT